MLLLLIMPDNQTHSVILNTTISAQTENMNPLTDKNVSSDTDDPYTPYKDEPRSSICESENDHATEHEQFKTLRDL